MAQFVTLAGSWLSVLFIIYSSLLVLGFNLLPVLFRSRTGLAVVGGGIALAVSLKAMV